MGWSNTNFGFGTAIFPISAQLKRKILKRNLYRSTIRQCSTRLKFSPELPCQTWSDRSFALLRVTAYIMLSAILGETSGGTSYQMVRLVFRPYTQIRRTICTSVSLQASTRVSPSFTLFRHRSPSFGSQQYCFYTQPDKIKKTVIHSTNAKSLHLVMLLVRIFLTVILTARSMMPPNMTKLLGISTL